MLWYLDESTNNFFRFNMQDFTIKSWTLLGRAAHVFSFEQNAVNISVLLKSIIIIKWDGEMLFESLLTINYYLICVTECVIFQLIFCSFILSYISPFLPNSFAKIFWDIKGNNPSLDTANIFEKKNREYLLNYWP